MLEPWDVRALSIRKTADLPLQLRVGTTSVTPLSEGKMVMNE
jgi:hypothetical protein